MTLLIIGLFVFLILIGMQVAFALAIAGSAGLWAIAGLDKLLVTLPTIMYGSLNSFTLIAIPLYILMGNIIIQARLSDDIYEVLNDFLGHVPGGLSIVNVLCCTIFAAISGSSVATVATVGMLVIPQMLHLGYKREFAFGITAAGGTLGILIPPSLNFILYGALTEESVGRLFMAGIIPGLILSFSFFAYGVIFCYIKGYKSDYKATWHTRGKSLKKAMPSLLIIPVIMIGIYTGAFTPTEAAGVGCGYALLLAITKKKLTIDTLRPALTDTLKTSCMILMIIVGAMIFGYVITVLQFPQKIVAMMTDYQVTQLQFLIGTFFLILFLGCFLECVSIMVILTPILFPVVLDLNISPIWFGVFITINMELALITPPVGLNLFVINTIIPDSRLEDIYRGIWPFLLLMIIGLVLIYIFPATATWLPSMMKG